MEFITGTEWTDKPVLCFKPKGTLDNWDSADLRRQLGLAFNYVKRLGGTAYVHGFGPIEPDDISDILTIEALLDRGAHGYSERVSVTVEMIEE